MLALRIITTVFIINLIIVILVFMKDFRWKRKNDRASLAGFTFMQLVYLMSLFCIWK